MAWDDPDYHVECIDAPFQKFHMPYYGKVLDV